MEKEIIFVTHNIGKIKSAEKCFRNLKFTTFNYELDEPRSDDIKEIATAKVIFIIFTENILEIYQKKYED